MYVHPDTLFTLANAIICVLKNHARSTQKHPHRTREHHTNHGFFEDFPDIDPFGEDRNTRASTKLSECDVNSVNSRGQGFVTVNLIAISCKYGRVKTPKCDILKEEHFTI
ncbi:uncharacterized protein LOC127286952 [Leptopilina boulardi]|uniref:uncharacterized protein LOC127286952 n=1 Tax=Leptopilina boulardi TaxID=63433 RepID=UPI0021F6262F|nr:uncharacterized protein LOC127286952 [Leptopilina boulardi]